MVVDVEMSDSIEAQKFFVKFLIPNLRPAHYLNWRLSPKSFAFAVKMIKNKVRVSLDNVLFLLKKHYFTKVLFPLPSMCFKMSTCILSRYL